MDVEVDKGLISACIQGINEAWIEGATSQLEEYFHEAMVIVPPDFEKRVEGRAACIASYEAFIRSASVQSLELDDPQIDVWGDTALCTYAYEIEYELDGRTYREEGRDCFVFSRTNGTWLVVWRYLTAY